MALPFILWAQTFTKMNNFPAPNAFCTWVFATSENDVFITSFNTHSLYTTHNGGATWNSVLLDSNVELALTDVYFTDSLNGWVVGNEQISGGRGRVYKTTDGGYTWQNVTASVTNNTGAATFGAIRFNGQNGIVGCDNGFVDSNNNPLFYTTNNGGISWTAVKTFPGASTGSSFSITRIANDPVNGTFQLTGTFHVFTNVILNSIDNGASFFVPYFEQNTGNNPLDIFNVNGTGSIYWMATHNPRKSTDNGLSFTAFQYPGLPNKRILSGFFSDPNNGYIVGDGSSIYKTADGGNTWTTLQSGGTEVFRNVFQIQNTVWVVGQGGAVYKSNNAVLNTLDHGKDNQVKIYPNPASDYIIIENASRDDIKLISVTGQLVSVKKIEKLSNGTLKADISNLNKGVYILKLKDNSYKILKD